MAYATQITISTGNKVSLNYQSQEVSVTLTYQLEREDSDVLAIVREKTAELARAHRAAWQGLRDAKVASKVAAASPSPNGATPGEAAPGGTEGITDNGTPSGDGIPPEAVSTPVRPAHLPPDPLVEPVAPLEPATPGQRGALRVLLDQARWNQERRTAHLLEHFGCERLEDLSGVQAAEWLLELQRAAREADQQHRLRASRNGAAKGAAKT